MARRGVARRGMAGPGAIKAQLAMGVPPAKAMFGAMRVAEHFSCGVVGPATWVAIGRMENDMAWRARAADDQ